MSKTDRYEAKRQARRLERPVEAARELALKLGLEPVPVNYWIVDYDEMNELIAYDGFQTRYPHWRWGMKYDRQRKQDRYAGGKAFEIVNNDSPANAFLQESNGLADQKAVITHVEAHADFFANNQWFGLFPGEEGGAAAMLERHAERIDEIASDPEIDREAVESWIDTVLALADTIDQQRAFSRDLGAQDDEDAAAEIDLAEQLDDLDIGEEVRTEVFDEEWLEAQVEEDPIDRDAPEADVLAFLREHGKAFDDDAGRAVDFEDWQREVLELLRAEAYYFAAQRMTKVMNEGWACVAPDTRVFTDSGLLEMREVVDGHTPVSDGEETRNVYDSNVVTDHDTVTVETRRGFELTGSNNHRIRQPDGSWIRLDELSIGDEIEVSGGNGTWSTEYVSIEWSNPEYTTLENVADEAGVSLWTVLRYRRTGSAREAEAIEDALGGYDETATSVAFRDPIRIPETVSESLGRFLGLLVGDGHVSTAAGQVGFTASEEARAEEFAGLSDELFGVDPSVEQQGNRWRTYLYSANLVEFLNDALGLPDGKSASVKNVPEAVLRSPKPVVAEFLRGLFDADGYAGDQGVILSTKSEDLSRTAQLLLSNFDVLSRRREQSDGCYHLHITGRSARTFQEEVGFGYADKSVALATYLDDLAWFEDERWTDEIVAVSEGRGTVYDISVDATHRYAAAGCINHNSYWESRMMAGETFADADEFVTYADHMAKVLASPGLNPYALGMALWTYVENRTNRREVLERLLAVEGVDWRNLEETVDWDAVLAALEPPDAVAGVGGPGSEAAGGGTDLDAVADLPDHLVDREAIEAAREGAVDPAGESWRLLSYEGLARRHYSLVRPEHRSFLRDVSRSELEDVARYVLETDRYATIEDALADVEYTAGWDRMYEIRESHNDVTFLDAFLTEEFVATNDYFTYEYSRAAEEHRVASTDPADVKKKLLLQFTNLGKPTITVEDGNYRNRNELLLGHHYNGVALDLEQAERVLERTFQLWGRPVNLATIVKEVDEHDVEVARRRNREPEPEEAGKLLRYDGEDLEYRDMPWSEVEHLAADDVDYDTKPEEWLQ